MNTQKYRGATRYLQWQDLRQVSWVGLSVTLLASLNSLGCGSPDVPVDELTPTATAIPITPSATPATPTPTSVTPTATPGTVTPTPDGTTPTATPTPVSTDGPDIEIATSSLDFGEVRLGESAERTLTVSNVGTAPLTFSLLLTADIGGDFTFGEGTEESGTLAPNDLLFLSVFYSPSEEGGASATLSIQSNDVDESEVEVSLVGSGLATSPDDQDGDGSLAGVDCDDLDPTVYPGAPEACDGKDNDCDTLTDEDGATYFYLDTDNDGYGDPATALLSCSPGAEYVAKSDDCDDQDSSTYPNAPESCDGLDNDCDEAVDEEVTTAYYTDEDADGHGNPSTAAYACFAEVGQVELGDDCDDQNALNYPGNTEVCDGVDNDCNTLVDDGLAVKVWYTDADGDEYGNSAVSTSSCNQPEGSVAVGGDCNDADAAINPGAGEPCDGVDNNCNSQVDEAGASTFYTDADGDGHGDPSKSQETCNPGPGLVSIGDDCDDTNAAQFPGNTEVCDSIDNNCDLQVDEGVQATYYQDSDSDGFGTTTTTKGCTAPSGYAPVGGDCNDANAAINPSRTEQCNGVDDNCDAQIDEGVKSTFYVDADKDGYGSFSDTQEACTAPSGYVANNTDCDDTRNNVNPATSETCDGLDNDCDTQIDEGLASSTWYTDGDKDGYGNDATAVQKCAQPNGTTAQGGDCNDADASINPAATESCDAKDNDCDNQVDEGVKTSYYVDADKDTYGQSGSTPLQACSTPTGYVSNSTDCDDTKATVNPAATESCNAIDDDCDAQVDEGLSNQTYYQDGDNDGYGNPNTSTISCAKPTGYVTDSTDCDDTKASVNPKATETCNTLDDDCDAQVDEGVTTAFYIDADADTFGKSGSAPTNACTAPTGYVSNALDCNDANNAIKPGATETCDTVDQDCDGQVDEGLSTLTYYADTDNDSFGNASSSVDRCAKPTGYVTNKTDCDDTNAAINPNATEVCDLVDNDCDSAIDENVKVNFYVDGDGDTYGKSGSTPVQACTAAPGYSANNTDCNDASATIYPGAPEQCNSVDDNCNGIADDGVVYSTWYVDADADGYGSTASSKVDCKQPSGYANTNTDCNDADNAINPGATEQCNSKDDDCDAQVDEGVKTTYYADADKDTYGDPASAQSVCSKPSGYVTNNTDCNDADNTIYPSANELCDSKDNDCDTQIDENVKTTYYADVDKDGYGSATTTTQACSAPSGFVADSTDCNDTDSTIYPTATELCDSKDNDCDNQVDEGAKTTYYADTDNDGYGNASSTTTACTKPTGYSSLSTDCNDTDSSINPGVPEICDNKDNNCDTQVDEGVKGTYYADSDKDTYGDPSVSTQSCTLPTGYVTNKTDCNDSDVAINPAATEVCDNKDNDCDAQTDEGVKSTYYRDADGDTYGDADVSTQSCTLPSGYVINSADCDDADASVNPGADEIRGNGIDEDCDGDDQAADLNGDGYGDIVSVNGTNGTTTKVNSYVYYGTAAGMPATRTDLPTLGAANVCIADYDNDGDLDLFFTNYRSDSVYAVNSYLYWNTPAGFTASNKQDIPTVGAQHCVASDINQDGYIDLVISNQYNGSSYAIASYVYMNSVTGFSTSRRFDLPTLGAYSSTAVDLNADGYKELIFSNYRNGSTYTQDSYLYWGSSVGYNTTNRTALPAIGPWKPATVADANGDGVLDILMNNHYNGSSYNVDSYLYYGPTFQVGTRTALPTNGNSGSHVADMDRDGFKDIVVGSYYDGDDATTSYVYFGSSRGFSTTNRQSLTTNRVWDTKLFDYNEDGYLDIAFAMYYDGDYATTSRIYLGSSTGYNTTNQWTLPTTGVRGIEIVDVDGDTWADTVFGAYYTGSSYTTNSYVYYGSPRGIPNTALTNVAGSGPLHVQVEELGTDSYPELILANQYDGTNYTVNASIYQGLARGYNATNRTQLPVLGASWTCINDLNKDGFKDIVFANFRNNTTRKVDSYIYWGGTAGYSTSARTTLPTLGANHCLIQDLNKDGFAEVIFSNYYDDTTYSVDSYVYWNSAGAFNSSNRTSLPTTGSTGVVAADFDKNGFLDLLFSNSYNGSSYNVDSLIYFGDSTGFSSSRKVNLPSHGSSGPAPVDDLDGNGYLDIVLNGYYDGDNTVNTYVYYGSVSGFNTTNRTTLAQNRTLRVKIADFNKDTYKDLLLVNYYDGDDTVSSYIWWGGLGGYSTSNRLALAGNRSNDAVVEDFDLNGYLDIAISTEYDGNYSTTSYVWYGSSAGYNTTNRVGLTTSSATFGVAADMDNDGLKDLVFASRRNDSNYSADSTVFWNSTRRFNNNNYQNFASLGISSTGSAGAQ